jgi:hypothetical protein
VVERFNLQAHYNWERFWCPREGVIDLSDGGYLRDPPSDDAWGIRRDTVPLSSITDVPCLGLLGEPGIGKSTALKDQRSVVDREITRSGGVALWSDLRQFQTDSRLCERIFDHPKFRAWREGHHQLHLFLDSLDECLLRISSVAALLLDELGEYPRDRLFLRVACRTAEWPLDLERGLKELWGQDRFGAYELAPLRRLDVVQAAEAEGLDHAALVTAEDVPWMIQHLECMPSEPVQEIWAGLIGRACDWQNPDRIGDVLDACERLPILRKTLARFINPVVLDSPEAQQMREDYRATNEVEERRRSNRLYPAPAEQVVHLLDDLVGGDLMAWWRLNVVMSSVPDSSRRGDVRTWDMRLLPGWQAAEETTRQRIVQAAFTYIREYDPDPSEWIDTGTFDWPAITGYRAFRLLMEEDPARLSSLPVKKWEQWAPFLILHPAASFSEERQVRTALVRLASDRAPAIVVNAVAQAIERENRDHGLVWTIHTVSHCWNEHLVEMVLSRVQDEALTPESMATLLCELLDHNVAPALSYAQSLLALPLPEDETGRLRAVVAARALLVHAEDAGWSAVWPAIQDNIEFGRRVVTAVAHEHSGDSWGVFGRLEEEQLTDLYLWLDSQFPASEDAFVEGANAVSPRENIALWRDAIVHHLQGRGTPAAVAALRRLCQALPESFGVRWTLLQAETNTRRNTWRPLDPDSILALARDRQARLVRSADELLDVIQESLRRLEQRLHAETPAVRDLWDRTARDAFLPVDENAFSDYIKRFLDDDLRARGIIVNREVVIRSTRGSTPGERTDIQVDALRRDPGRDTYDALTVIIEVKGSWNDNLNDAMRSQLAERYLSGNNYQHGLYLVGWFDCDQLDAKGYRKVRSPGLTLDKAREKFADQAAVVSEQCGVVIRSFVIDATLR